MGFRVETRVENSWMARLAHRRWQLQEHNVRAWRAEQHEPQHRDGLEHRLQQQYHHARQAGHPTRSACTGPLYGNHVFLLRWTLEVLSGSRLTMARATMHDRDAGFGKEPHMSGMSCRRMRGWLLTARSGSLPRVASTSTSRPA